MAIIVIASVQKMVVFGLFLLSLFWSQVHCQQAFPYVSFMGQTLNNNSYVDLSLVGSNSNGSDSVQCHTDLSTCCRYIEGIHRGDWYFPSGNRLEFLQNDIYQRRAAQRVDLRNTHAPGPTGIYRCDVPTVSVHDGDVRKTVYLGLYNSDTGINRVNFQP